MDTPARPGGKAVRLTAAVFFIIGSALFVLNVAGLFISLRNPDIYAEPLALFKDDITLTFARAEKGIARRPGETDEELALRLNELVNQGLAHYWLVEGADRYHLRVPIWENYLLHLKSRTDPAHYLRYEYVDPRKALERGAGLCSQHAIVLAGLLDENGVEYTILPLGGHVVVGALVADDHWIVLDPDYGVAIPYDIRLIMGAPELVRPYYKDVRDGYLDPVRDDLLSVDGIVEFYGPSGNYILSDVKNFVSPERYYFEVYSRYAKWMIPLLFCLPFISLAALKAAGGKSQTKDKALESVS